MAGKIDHYVIAVCLAVALVGAWHLLSDTNPVRDWARVHMKRGDYTNQVPIDLFRSPRGGLYAAPWRDMLTRDLPIEVAGNRVVRAGTVDVLEGVVLLRPEEPGSVYVWNNTRR